MEEKQLRYLESFKRLYFKNSHDNEKGRSILDKKAKSLGLSDDEVKEFQDELLNKYNDFRGFLSDIIDINLKNNDECLSEDDRVEALEYAKDLGIENDETDMLIDYIIENCYEMNEEDEAEVSSTEEDVKLGQSGEESKETAVAVVEEEPEEERVDVINISHSKITLRLAKNRAFERVGIIYFDGLLNSAYDFREALYTLKGRREFTRERMLGMFNKCFSGFFEDMHRMMLKLGLIDYTISQSNIESLVDRRIIANAAEAIEELNYQANSGISSFKAMNNSGSSSTTLAFGSLGFMAAVGTASLIGKAGRSMKKGYENMKFESEIDKKAYEAILGGVSTIIEELLKSGVDSYNKLTAYFKVDVRNISELLIAKEKAQAIVENAGKMNVGRDSDEYYNMLAASIEYYPYLEDTYLELLKRIDGGNIDARHHILKIASDNVDTYYSGGRIFEELERVSGQLYKRELKAIKQNGWENIEQLMKLLKNASERFSVDNPELIASLEYEILGYIYSLIDMSKVSMELRLKYYKKDLENIKNQKDLAEEEIRKKAEELKNKYQIGISDAVYEELRYFGFIVSSADFSDMKFEDKKKVVTYALECIKNLNFPEERNRELAGRIRRMGLVSKYIGYELEETVFGKAVSVSDEDSVELKFITESLNIYQKLGSNPFGEGFTHYKNQYFDHARFMNDYSEFRKKVEDKVLFSGKQKTLIFNPKEGFVISSKYVYSYGWKTSVMIKDINSVIVRNKEFTSDGKIYKTHEIELQVNGQEKNLEIYAIYMDNKPGLAKFMWEIFKIINPSMKFFDYVNGYAYGESEEEKEGSGAAAQVKKDEASKQQKQAYVIKSNPVKAPESKVSISGNAFAQRMSDFKGLSTIEIVLKCVNAITSSDIRSHIYASGENDKSDSKISKAVNSYAGVEDGEIPLICFDNTAFGGAKDGFLITDKNFYCHNMMETSWKIAIKDIEKIEKNGSEIYLQNRKVDTTLISGKDKGEFRELVEYVVFSLRNVSGGTKTSASEPAAKSSTNKLTDREYLNLASAHVNSIEKPNIKKYVFSITEGKNIVDKFDKAITAYCKLKEGEMPLVLFDNTAFGSAKDGFLITDTTVYAHNMWQASIQIPIESIMSIKVVGSDLIINGQKIYITMIDSSDRKYFEDFCNRLLLTLREHVI